MSNRFNEIVQILKGNDTFEVKQKINRLKRELICFDDIVDSHNNTLLHFFFLPDNYKLISSENLDILLDCFYSCDIENDRKETPLHLFIKNNIDGSKFKKIYLKGFDLHHKDKLNRDLLSIFEITIKFDNYTYLSTLISLPLENFFLKSHFNELVGLIFRFESENILNYLLSTDESFSESALKFFRNFSSADANLKNELISLIKQSKKNIFDIFFSKDNKIITLEMLYYCTKCDFCIFLAEHTSKEQFKHLDTSKTDVLPEIMSLLEDFSDNVYLSRTLIHDKVEKGDLAFIQKLPLMMLDSTDYNGDTPLIIALRNNQDDIAEYLIKSGQCDFCHLGSKTTPLHLASQGKPKLLEEILKSDMFDKNNENNMIDIRDRDGNTPLVALFLPKEADATNINCIKLLIDHGANINERCSKKQSSILEYSITKKIDNLDRNFIEFLISKLQFDNDEMNKDSVLENLIKFGQDENLVVSFIKKIKIGAENWKNILSSSYMKKKNYIFQILEQIGKDNTGAIFECFKKALQNENFYCLEEMISYIPQLSFYIGKHKKSILFFLAKRKTKDKKYQELCKCILDKIIQHDNIILAQSDKTKENIFHVAIRHGNIDFIKFIIKYCDKEKTAIVEQLLNDTDIFGISPKELILLHGVDIECGLFNNDYSFEEVESFLKKTNNPYIKIPQKNITLFNYCFENELEDENRLLHIFDIFSRYGYDFSNKFNEKYIVEICIEKRYTRAINFLIEKGGGLIIDVIDSFKREMNNDYTDFKDIFDSIEKLLNVIDELINVLNKIQKDIQDALNQHSGKFEKTIEEKKNVNPYEFVLNILNGNKNEDESLQHSIIFLHYKVFPLSSYLRKCLTFLHLFIQHLQEAKNKFSLNYDLNPIFLRSAKYIEDIFSQIVLKNYKTEQKLKACHYDTEILGFQSDRLSDVLSSISTNFSQMGEYLGRIVKAHPHENMKQKLSDTLNEINLVCRRIGLIINDYEFSKFFRKFSNNNSLNFANDFYPKEIPTSIERECDVLILYYQFFLLPKFDKYKFAVSPNDIILVGYNDKNALFIFKESILRVFLIKETRVSSNNDIMHKYTYMLYTPLGQFKFEEENFAFKDNLGTAKQIIDNNKNRIKIDQIGNIDKSINEINVSYIDPNNGKVCTQKLNVKNINDFKESHSNILDENIIFYY